jgi:hypothetical protein
VRGKKRDLPQDIKPESEIAMMSANNLEAVANVNIRSVDGIDGTLAIQRTPTTTGTTAVTTSTQPIQSEYFQKQVSHSSTSTSHSSAASASAVFETLNADHRQNPQRSPSHPPSSINAMPPSLSSASTLTKWSQFWARWKRLFAMAGPGSLISVGYMDPVCIED